MSFYADAGHAIAMKSRPIVSLILFMLQPIFLFAAETGPRAAAWKAVEEAVNQGLPKTAIERLQPIADAALADKAWAEATKAIARRITLETVVQSRAEEKVRGYTEALRTAPVQIQPILQTLLGHAYWDYFRQNNWRIRQRTASAGSTSTDFQTWDLKRLFAEIDSHFQAALTNDEVLKRTAIAEFKDLLQPGNVPDSHRPTLYDFLAHEALGFYAAGEQAGAKPEDAFEIDAESPIFAGLDTFLAWRPATTDTQSVAFKAVALLQAVARFHARDTGSTARLEADLGRLRYAGNVATGATKDARHIAALRAFIRSADTHELAAWGYHDLARILQRQEQLAEAHLTAAEGARRFPTTPGGDACSNIVLQIEQPTVQLSADHVWSSPNPEIQVRYRNVTHVWFRAVSVNWEDFLDRRKPRPENFNRAQSREYLKRPVARQWDAALPPTTDFREWRQFVPAPVDLTPGYYFILASHRADFADDENSLTMTPVWVSRLGLVIRPRAGQLEGFVLDAQSGEPVAGARVDAWYLGNNGERVGLGGETTDDLGFFAFRDRKSDRGCLLRAKAGNDTVATAGEVYSPGQFISPGPAQMTFFFTDRALYRPGQLIQYKGLCVQRTDTNANYRVLAGRQVAVVLRDPNGKEIARQSHRANDYGSFAGTFNAPRNGLTGPATIAVEGQPIGSTTVVVEEYKRPKFQASLDAPKTAPRIGDAVRVEGRALAYTGAAIDGANVSWRVTREVRFPPWWGWFRFGPVRSEGAQEIAHGTTSSSSDGSFTLDFKALPDASVPEKDEPVFHFSVHADVTDSAGETRSATRSVKVGYTAIEPALVVDEWQVRDRPVEIRSATRTLDGEPLAAEGTLRILRVTQPAPAPRNGPILRDQPDKPDGPNRWPAGELVKELNATHGAAGTATNRMDLGAGLYRIEFATRDRFGKTATAKLTVRVLDPAADKLGPDEPQVIAAPAWEIEPGGEFTALWGTGSGPGRAFIEFEHRDTLVQRFWTGPGRTQQLLKLAVTEAMRGGFTLHVTQVRDNHGYLHSRAIGVPWSNKELDVKWETFRSRLEPGSRETWTAVIKPKLASGESAPAELVAALYDASLDQFRAHSWMQQLPIWPAYPSSASATFANHERWFTWISEGWKNRWGFTAQTYRHFPQDLIGGMPGGRMFGRGLSAMSAMSAKAIALSDSAAPAMAMAAAPASGAGGMEARLMSRRESAAAPMEKDAALADGSGAPPSPSTGQVTARKNLQETAYFLPQLTSDSNGVVRLTFTMPEALTEWRFLGFAHDRLLRSGSLEGRTVTAKEIMVQPNPPRFLREGDQLEFSVKVSNQSTNRQSGNVRLDLAFARDDSSANGALGLRKPELSFDIPAKESRAFSWRLTIPDGCGFLRFKSVAATDRLSDGEEGYVPVLSRRIFVTEALPLPIRGPATKKFDFAALRESSKSKSLRHDALTFQVVSQPAWYAVLALPYLMEYPHECAEQIFNRLYANALARHIATTDPKIRRVFDQWRGTPALDSPLEKNADLKSIALEETPWVRNAADESQSRRNIGLLFEETRLNTETAEALRKLTERQLPEGGGWSWFPGGSRDDYITLYIVTGFGRLRHLGVAIDTQLALRNLETLDAWMNARYERLRERKLLGEAHLDPTVALYLYGRSFFIGDRPIHPAHIEAVNFWIGQARQHWLKLARQSQAHIALAFTRLGNLVPQSDAELARQIVRSIKEHSVRDEELGRFWRDQEFSTSWSRAPIETQALMIEAFNEITQDSEAVDDCQTWLLKQKQTQSWNSTKGTADAVYALLLRGRNLLASDALVEVAAGGRNLTPTRNRPRTEAKPTPTPEPEPGTGFYQVRIPGNEVTPGMSEIVLRKTDTGVSWGSAHWQYFEDIDRVKAFTATPLKLTKSAFIRENTKSGKSLRPVNGPVKVGDELVVRIELRVDRDVEYIHLKDQRGSGTEPVNVMSGYRFQDGLGYYESTRDTASHFFIGYLAKGTYVFEYPVRVQHRGAYATGVASVECMYAPEFNSHSASIPLEVK